MSSFFIFFLENQLDKDQQMYFAICYCKLKNVVQEPKIRKVLSAALALLPSKTQQAINSIGEWQLRDKNGKYEQKNL